MTKNKRLKRFSALEDCGFVGKLRFLVFFFEFKNLIEFSLSFLVNIFCPNSSFLNNFLEFQFFVLEFTFSLAPEKEVLASRRCQVDSSK